MPSVKEVTASFALLLAALGWAAASCDAASTTTTVEIAGEPGLTIETAITLEDATNEMNGIHAEHVYTSKHYPGWKWKTQSLMNAGDSHYDLIELVGPKGETKTIYFDITDWFGKMQ